MVSKEMKNKIINLYLDGYSTGKIAEMLKIAEFEVVRTLQRAGLMRAV